MGRFVILNCFKLDKAVSLGRFDIIKYLVEEEHIIIDMTSHDIMRAAIKTRNYDIIAYLLKWGYLTVAEKLAKVGNYAGFI